MMTEKEREDFEGLETRTFALEFERTEDTEESRTISMSFASEEPVLRSFGWEILSHEVGDIDFDFIGSGRAPLLLSHDPETQIGVVESASLSETERKSRAVVRFGNGSLASEIFRDVQDKIRANISVGYTITELMKQDEQREGQDVYRAKFQPKEISVVSIPADTNVGVGRSEIEKSIIESEKMENITTEIVSEPVRKDEIDFKKEVDDILAQRAKDNKEMQQLGYRHNLRDFADECIAKNMSLYEFRTKILDKIETKPLDSIEDPLDMKPKEQKRYSFLKALNAASRGDWSSAGFEHEMSREMAHKSGKSPQGFFVPDYAWRSDLYNNLPEKREWTVGTDGSGGFFAPSVQLGSEWINALRAKMVLSDLGMRTMSGLTTKVQIPKISAGSAAAFVAESGNVSDQTATTAQLTLQARTLGASSLVSRLLLLESDPSIEQIVRDDLVAAIASKIQDVMIEGGGSNEPTGVTKTSGVGAITVGDNGGPPTWALLTNLVREVEVDNAVLNESSLGFLTNPKLKSKMAQVAKVGSSDSVMLLNDPWNSLYGYPIRFTTDCPSNLTKGTTSGVCSALIYGDWSQLILASWGNSPDILVDPYSSSSDGSVKIVVFSEIDAGIRNAQSFAITVDYTTT
jgi:HK97 family phage major capsid protein/HK97 family phage prohead protease